jgi:hypothetical protein
MLLDMASSPRIAGPPCDGCLGSRQCWVCLGQGRCERPDGGSSPCARCSGSGRCSFCRPAVAGAPPDLPDHPDAPRLQLDRGSSVDGSSVNGSSVNGAAIDLDQTPPLLLEPKTPTLLG